MKKLLISLSCLFFATIAFAQVTTNPAFITKGYTGEFTVIFDATKGSKGMVGSTTCYAHTGVITNKSTSDSDWKHAPTWGTNTTKYKMTSIGTDLWQLTITGGMQSYYGLAAGEEVTKLAFVFRDQSGSKTGKTSDDGDIFYDLYDVGTLSIQLKEPLDGAIYYEGETVPYSLTVSNPAIATADMYIDDVKKETIALTNGTAEGLVSNLAIGSHTVGFFVTDGEKSSQASAGIVIASKEMEKPVPAGMKEGINYNPDTKEVTLLFRAPLSHDVYILGDFNDWKVNEDYHMYYEDVKYEDEANPTRIFWRTFTVPDTSEKYGFVYKVDGSTLVGDPYATVVLDPWNDKYIPAGIRDNSLPAYPTAIKDVVVSVLVLDEDPYPWQVPDFKIKDKEQLVIYELLIRDFVGTTTKGNLNGVISKLDYLQTLGVNAIELMPVTEFDGNESWGYAPSYFFAYDKAYGTKKIYKKFIDECHKRGIAVILDMVFNHATGNCPFAKLYWSGDAPAENNPWMNRVAPHMYSVYNDFNHEYEGTRKYFKRVLEYWLKEFKVDGYRMDLVKGLTQKKGTEESYDQTRINILKDYNSVMKEVSPEAVFILEHLGHFEEQKVLVADGMIPWRNMNYNFCQAAMGMSTGSNFVDTKGTGGMYDLKWVGYGESHDEERNMYKANTASTVKAIKGHPEVYIPRAPMNMAFVALLPGPKMFWQFMEMGYDISINQCDGSSTIKDDCRTDPKPNIWKKKWDKDATRMDAYEKCGKIIRLRTLHPEFFTDSTVTTTNVGTATYLNTKLRRIDVNYKAKNDGLYADDIDIIVLVNYNISTVKSMPGGFSRTGVWYEYLSGTEINVEDVDADIALEPNSIKIFTSRKLSDPVSAEEFEVDNNGDGIDVSVVPSVTNDKVYIYCSEKILQTNVYGMSGELLISADGNTTELSLAGLNKGMYLVSVNCAGGKSVRRVIKE